MAYNGRLVMKWSKREQDVVIHYPRSVDGHLAHSTLSEPIKTFLDEMEKRGYDRNSFFLKIKRNDP
jgi:hypothetical protein